MLPEKLVWYLREKAAKSSALGAVWEVHGAFGNGVMLHSSGGGDTTGNRNSLCFRWLLRRGGFLLISPEWSIINPDGKIAFNYMYIHSLYALYIM